LHETSCCVFNLTLRVAACVQTETPPLHTISQTYTHAYIHPYILHTYTQTYSCMGDGRQAASPMSVRDLSGPESAMLTTPPLPSTRCRLHVAVYTLPSTRCRLHVAVYTLPSTTRCRLHVAVYTLPSTRCRLHVAVYTLPSTRCRLHVAVYTLPSTRCRDMQRRESACDTAAETADSTSVSLSVSFCVCVCVCVCASIACMRLRCVLYTYGVYGVHTCTPTYTRLGMYVQSLCTYV
jgi:hypothetical protein